MFLFLQIFKKLSPYDTEIRSVRCVVKGTKGSNSKVHDAKNTTFAKIAVLRGCIKLGSWIKNEFHHAAYKFAAPSDLEQWKQ